MKGKWPNGLRSAMEARGIGPAELARAIGTSRQNVQRWRDEERELSRDWAIKIAPHLETSVVALLLIPATPAPAKRSPRMIEFLAAMEKLDPEELDDAAAETQAKRARSDQPASPPAPQQSTTSKAKSGQRTHS